MEQNCINLRTDIHPSLQNPPLLHEQLNSNIKKDDKFIAVLRDRMLYHKGIIAINSKRNNTFYKYNKQIKTKLDTKII